MKKNKIPKKLNPNLVYNEDGITLIKGDSLQLLKEIEDNSVDLIFSDPPYFLSNDGISCHSGKMVSVNKGKWDKSTTYSEIEEFNCLWLSECQRILKPNALALNAKAVPILPRPIIPIFLFTTLSIVETVE